jgi:hypothetical protein
MQDYRNYGGRGIKVCDEWIISFEAFFLHVGSMPTPDHSIERIDFNKNYEPGNVRWATKIEQANNRRVNVRLDLDGIVRTIAEWEDVLGLKHTTIGRRLERGWSIKEALTVPVKPGGANRLYQPKQKASPKRKTKYYRGVRWIQGRYVAIIIKDGKRIYIGRFRDEGSAATAYNFKTLELFGASFKYFNLPREIWSADSNG